MTQGGDALGMSERRRYVLSVLPPRPTRLNRRSLLAVAVLGVALTVLSFNVDGHATVTYGDIMGCESGCEQPAAGWPVPFVVDYPGLSPSGSVGGFWEIWFGIDKVFWGRLAASFAFWLAVSAAVMWAVRLVLARRAV